MGLARHVRIDIEALAELSYAMAHNGVPFIEALVLHGCGREVPGAEVRIEVRDAACRLSRPWSRLVDLPATGPVVLTALGAALDPAAMAGVEEARPASALVTVHSPDGELIGTGEVGVHLLAAQQWRSRPTELGLEVLAAFVMPNHPAVGRLLDDAREILADTTGSASMQGYQAGSERADEVAGAIYAAMAERRIRYSEPPASWSDVGQKVRTPAQVLEGRVGTCLDTTLVMAAALEAAGLHPLVWVTSDHAFAGYWRTAVSLAGVVSADLPALVNRVDLGHLRLVETTSVTDRDEPVPFAATHRQPYADHLVAARSDVVGVLDVRAARASRILPLPASERAGGAGGGGVQVVEYSPPPSAPAGGGATVRVPAPSASSDAPVVPPRIQAWKDSLLDLSLHNRLINDAGRHGVHLTVPDGHLATLAELVTGGTAVDLLPGDAIDSVHTARGAAGAGDLPASRLEALLAGHHAVHVDVTSAAFATRLAGLAHRARTITEETGANNLHLTLGSLVWDVEGRALRSPLVLVPVTLIARARGPRGTGYQLQLDEAGAATPNHCLLEKLRQVHGLTVPDLAAAVGEHGLDLRAALAAVRVALTEHGLSCRVEEDSHLAVLAFAKYRLWKDLDDHWPTFLANPLVRHLALAPTDPFTDPVPAGRDVDLDELAAACPVAADATQLGAVADAVAGRTFVLEGPPGTGKSQTITNILSRAMAEGHRVLFVAEKRAALDVVADRLAAVGLGGFCLDLHDRASKASAVRAAIRAALLAGVDLDEQGLAAGQDDLRAARRVLSRYAQRLHESNGAGLSYYSARTKLLATDGAPTFTVPARLLAASGAGELAALRAALARLPDVADVARPGPHHPWGLVGLRGGASPDPTRTREAAAALDVALADLDDACAQVASTESQEGWEQVLAAVTHPGHLRVLAELAASPGLTTATLDATRTHDWQAASRSLTRDVEQFAARTHPCLDVVVAQVLNLPLAQLHARAAQARSSGFFGRTRRLRAVADELAAFVRPGVAVAPKTVWALTSQLVALRGDVDDLVAAAAGVAGLALPRSWNPLLTDQGALVGEQVRWLAWMGAALDPADPFAGPLRAWMATQARAPAPTPAALRGALDRAADALVAFARTAAVAEATCLRWAGPIGLLARWRATAAGRGLTDTGDLALRRHVAHLQGLAPLRAAGMVGAHEQLLTADVATADAVRALERGVAAASMTERAGATGLDQFDPLAHAAAITRFTRSAAAVRSHMTTDVPAQVLASRGYDPATSRGRVGELTRQLSRQRGGLGVRGLMADYGDLITAAMPCVLVSPDSLARFFPAGPPGSELFDLVVFDEASQIRVADAIGAMGRAHAVVVVGDSQQMPPTSFGEAASDPDSSDEDLAVADSESILGECVLARVPRRWLSWHYRSQDESLIAFSNHHYYEDRLSSFPAPAPGGAAGSDERGISLVRVDGQFHRAGTGRLLRTNPTEAAAVVAEVARRFAASQGAPPSLGVITFNAPQRALIEAMLAETGDERIAAALAARGPEGLFVKNLENVQGDERDVVLFSTAFSANARGVLPLTFGPLNRAGGERRLNVAITRARRQVVVFTSFDPAQLRAGETTSVGIKHLRAYLDLAADPTASPAGRRRPSIIDRHRDEVAGALRARGLVVTTDVGLSDFRVDLAIALPDAPERSVVAVLLDGPAWAARRTVGDRDGLPVDVLSALMRWPVVERVWMPDWLADAGGVADRLHQRATAAGARPLAEVIDVREAVRSIDLDHASELNGEQQLTPWRPGRRGPRSVLDALPEPSAAAAVRAALAEAVAVEGPIHRERLARLVAAAFDLSRAGQGRMTRILDQLPADLGPRTSEPFVWPASLDPATWTGFRRGQERPLAHVCFREIGNAMVALCSSSSGSASAGMPHEELLRQTAAIFGGGRVTPVLGDRLEEALQRTAGDGRLSEGEGGVWVARSAAGRAALPAELPLTEGHHLAVHLPQHPVHDRGVVDEPAGEGVGDQIDR